MTPPNTRDTHVIAVPADEMSPGDFLRRLRGLPPLTAAEKAEKLAERERWAARGREYAKAQKEAAELMRQGKFEEADRVFEALKDEDFDDGPTDCPQCGEMLVEGKCEVGCEPLTEVHGDPFKKRFAA